MQDYPEHFDSKEFRVPVASQEERTWAMLCHLSTLLSFTGAFFLGIVGPLVIWMIKRDTMPLVEDQGKEAINFQISILIYAIIAGILLLAFIGFVLLPAVLLFDIIVTIIAAMKANEGVYYRYPLSIRFIK